VYEFTVSGMYIPDFLITTGGIPFASFAAEQRWWPNSDEGTMSALCAEQRWESARPHTNFPKFVIDSTIFRRAEIRRPAEV
jgi:hypothetical protein